jgi:hypothetical protein
MALKVPPVTLKSPAVPFHVKVLLTSSLKVSVTVAVSSAFKLLLSNTIVLRMGAVVSTL